MEATITVILKPAMKFSTISLALLPFTAMACPGSGAAMHAKCQMDVSFDNSCDSVMSEMTGRVNSKTWTDPHNGGIYSITRYEFLYLYSTLLKSLLSSNSTYLAGQRITGDGKYTDKFDFYLTPSGSGCSVEACSESQVSSIIDYSTNYCNLHDLYCSSKDGCPTVGSDLTYTEKYSQCIQHDDVCIA